MTADLSQDWARMVTSGVDTLRRGKRAQVRDDTWFIAQEITMEEREAFRRAGGDPDSAAEN